MKIWRKRSVADLSRSGKQTWVRPEWNVEPVAQAFLHGTNKSSRMASTELEISRGREGLW